MTRFRLIGQTTEFNVVRHYLAAGFIPSVHGITDDGMRQTCARAADIMEIATMPITTEDYTTTVFDAQPAAMRATITIPAGTRVKVVDDPMGVCRHLGL